MSNQKKSSLVRLLALIAILIALFLAMRFLPVHQWLKNFNDWVGHIGAAGIFIFIGVYVIATILLAPGSILTIGAGFTFGLWKGFLAVSVGATLGAAFAFLVARFVAREKIETLAQQNEKFRHLDNAIGREGAKLIFLLRLSPVIPFNLSNYFYGLTAVKFWSYLLASWIGMMPGNLLYVYIGTAGKAAISAVAGGEAIKRGWQYWTFLSIGLAATLVVTVWVTKIARNTLRQKPPRITSFSGIRRPDKGWNHYDRSTRQGKCCSSTIRSGRERARG
jgi:uncharacterized membrane protein YdjX (TVP38/TMEM64 family)